MGRFRQFLYSKWFFGVLAIVCLVDLAADLSEHMWVWTDLNWVAIAMDATAAALTLWLFADLHRRRPRNGGGTRRRG